MKKSSHINVFSILARIIVTHNHYVACERLRKNMILFTKNTLLCVCLYVGEEEGERVG